MIQNPVFTFNRITQTRPNCAAPNKAVIPKIRFFGKSFVLIMLFLVLGIPGYSIDYKTINFDVVNKLAKKLSKNKYSQEDYKLPPAAAALPRDQYNQIKFLRNKQLWDNKGILFRLNLYPLGSVFKFPVKINEFRGSYTETLRYSPDFYNFGKIKKQMKDISGYAGFKLLCQLNKKDEYVSFIDFLGGSTFKALGKNNFFGAYSEGISINQNIPDQKVEYAHFKEFWIEKPDPKTPFVTVYALLDIPSATGAYEFRITPDIITKVNVKSVIYLRNPVKLLGLSPIISFFYYGENSKNIFEYNHHEIHSSDGLVITTNDGQTWQPLVNPTQEQITLSPVKNIRCFGLLQRDRNYDNYMDLYTPYQLEPNVWITPDSDWNSGSVYLIETPSLAEGFNSNIRVLWIPDAKLKPGEPYRFDYTMHWSMEQPKYKVGIVTSTCLAAKANNKNKQTSFTIYFDSHELQKLDDAAKVKAIATISSNARFLGEPQVLKDPYNKQWRVVLEVEPDLNLTTLPLVELSCKLLANNKVITETWSYRWRP